MQYLEKLNQEQKNAVIHKDGPVLIVAGAGAGKTRTITYRIVHIINQGVDPKNILAVTFTNKAANEMTERVNYLLEHEPSITRPISYFEKPHIKTFHSLGVHILKNHADRIGFKKNFSIFDRDDSKKLIRQIIKDLGFDPKEIDPGKVISIISKQKGDMISSFDYEEASRNYLAQNIGNIWREYDEKLKEENAFDFDDLLVKSLEILTKHPDVRNFYQDTFQFIHVDEYQDTNKIQYETVRLLADKHRNICVVGDIDQNIYSWRGASIQNMLNFEKDYPEAKIVRLEENYRSTKNIIAVANDIIEKNSNRLPKNLYTKNSDGEKIFLYNAIDETDEARYVVDQSKKIIKDGVAPNKIAVLYRANFQSRVLEEMCLKENLPYQVLGVRFFERKEIKDLVSYLKVAINQDDFSNLSRIINEPIRGIGKTTLLKLKMKQHDDLNESTKQKIYSFWKIIDSIKEKASKNKLSDTIAHTIKVSGMEESFIKQGQDGLERLDNLRELISLAKKYDNFSPEEAMNIFMEEVALATDQDSLNKDNGGIKLMTVHASKGLEFNTVFVVGLEQGLFPFERDSEEKKDEEEERRLFYVAVTRAEKKLFLTWATFRTIFGNKEITTPSEFLEDINEIYFEKQSFTGEPEKQKGKIEYLIDW